MLMLSNGYNLDGLGSYGLGQLSRQFDRLFSEMERGWSLGPQWIGGKSVASAPGSMVLKDTGTELCLTADLPGMKQEDLQLNLAGDTLTISGHRPVEVPEGYEVLLQERTGFRFSRKFQLPCLVDADAVTATLEHGVLEIRLPRAKQAAPRRIPINTVSK